MIARCSVSVIHRFAGSKCNTPNATHCTGLSRRKRGTRTLESGKRKQRARENLIGIWSGSRKIKDQR